MVEFRAPGARRARLASASPVEIARQAAFGLFEQNPEASAGRRLAPPAALLLGPITFLAGLGLAMPGKVLTALILLTYGYILAISLLRLAAAGLTPLMAKRQRLKRSELPVISVVVALYQESEVVAGLCAGLSRIDYPADRLDVLLVLEASDTDTVNAARAAARRTGFTVLVAPACGPQTKPRALNFALHHAKGSLVAVYDAEDAPHPAQLIAAAESFAADASLGVLQAPLSWYNATDCWLTRQFALEYAAQFHGLLPALARLGAPLPLGGTSNIFRAEALRAVGGWDAFNVTEDADLGFRLARHGWRSGLIAPGTGEEAPTELKPWIGQRSRWLKGHLVTWLVQMRDPRGLVNHTGWRGLAALQVSLLANVFSALTQVPGLALALAGLISLALGQAQAVTLAGLGLGLVAWASALVCLWVSAGRAGVGRSWFDILTAPAYWLCQLPAVWRALQELGSQPYVWVKTRHGVSTTRREAPDDPVCHINLDGGDRRSLCVLRLEGEPAV
jgi:cellulose synthase/poly-beta-1,6-N-acetylglucosamine synthase-like glycosyltransferase